MLFIVVYRSFLAQPNAGKSVLLGMIIAAMIYSKYHAFLVVGLTILSNLKLLKNKFFYLAVAVSVILLSPHVFWQIENEFPTFKYHLVERAKPFRLKYVFPNLMNQLLMAGPLTGVLIFWKLSKFKVKNDFQRAMIFNILGFYILFFLLSFKNRIEAHWSAAIMPMLMMVTYPLMSEATRVKLWFKRLAVPVIILMFIYRIYLALDIIPNVGHTKITFYNREASAFEIKDKANGRKVGFFNNYAAISNYIFYTGDSAVHLSTPDYRFCQYDLWNDEKYAEGEKLFALQSKHLNPPILIKMATGEMKGFIEIEKFQSLKHLLVKPEKIVDSESAVTFYIELNNTSNRIIYTRHVSEPALGIMQNGTEFFVVSLTQSSAKKEINPGTTALLVFSVPKNLFDTSHSLTIYTRSKNNVRGELITIHPNVIAGK